MGKVIVNFDIPGMTLQQYDQVWQDLKEAGYSNPKGLIFHVGAQTAKGWMVVDVWESAEHFDEFGKTLLPILAKNGVPTAEPVLLPLHYLYSGS